LEATLRDVQVTGRGLEVSVTEQELNRAQVGAVIQQVGGK